MKTKLFVVAVCAFALGMVAQWVNERTPAVAAAPMHEWPSLYAVGTWSGISVYWFESAGTECFVTSPQDHRGSAGISCLRKEQP